MSMHYLPIAEGYEVRDGDRRIGTIRRFHPQSRVRRGRSTVAPQWYATDRDGRISNSFPTRGAAAVWLAAMAALAKEPNPP